MIELVEAKLQEKWSPEQISCWLLVEKKILLSHERIYLHVWADSPKVREFRVDSLVNIALNQPIHDFA